MRGRSLQFRITAVATVVVFVVLCAAALVLTAIFGQAQEALLDSELRADARLAEAVLSDGVAATVLAEEQVVIQLVDGDGAVVRGTDSAPAVPVIPVAEWPAGETAFRTITFEGRTGRVLIERVPGEEMVLLVGRSLEPAQAAAATLRRLLAVGVPFLAIALAGVIWWVVGRALRPVEIVRAEVNDISARDLSRRLPPPETGDELDRLVATMNALLGRLETSVARERQFVADAGHELRSPLSGARALLESEQTDPDSIADTRARVLATLARLETIVDDLLSLATADAGAVSRPPHSPVDLDELVLGQADRLRRTTPLRIDTGAVSGGQVHGRDTDLGRLVDNLTANAQRHTTSVIALGVDQDDGWVTLTVDDDGPGIAPADRTRVFERFTRLDEARTRSAGGAGLGLAIVAAIVEDHGGTVAIETSSLGGARFVVRLPASG